MSCTRWGCATWTQLRASRETVARTPQTHLTGHSEGENALLDATVDVWGAVYGFALNVVAGQELERGRGGVSQT